ncbi:MAG TPA: hypothetical protein VD866_21460 [Urbifossiella sp.]|nr:hypothetical protein [Urbifossiella sp.]
MDNPAGVEVGGVAVGVGHVVPVRQEVVFAEGEQPSATCTVCRDDRQYVKLTGQQ